MQAQPQTVTEVYSKMFIKSLASKKVGLTHDQCSRHQIFPHCEDEFYPSKTLPSDSLIAKETLYWSLASHVDLYKVHCSIWIFFLSNSYISQHK